MVPLIDTHAHLSMLPEKSIDVHETLAALAAAGFGGVVDVGTRSGDLEGRLADFGAYPWISFSAGIWPSREAIAAVEEEVADLGLSIAAVKASSSGKRLVAVGECGIDRHWNRREEGADLEGERKLLALQAALALELDLPIIVHSREAAEETAEILSGFPGLRGVIHCFSYGPEEARRFLDLGFYLSFSGTVTYKKAEELRNAARIVPSDRLLAETDSPYLAPVPFRGKSADPSMVAHTYLALSMAREETPEATAGLIVENARTLFRLP